MNKHDIAEKERIRQSQLDETVNQEMAYITVRLAVVTCPGCDRKRAVIDMYKCLYCDIWFCRQCAEDHFGKTVEEYRQAAG